MAQQMQQQGQEPGEGEQAGGPGNPRDGQPREHRPNANSDPLGRETHDRRDNNRQLYDPLGVPAAQRAQREVEAVDDHHAAAEHEHQCGDPVQSPV